MGTMDAIVLALTTTDFVTSLDLKGTGITMRQTLRLVDALAECRAPRVEIRLWGCVVFKDDCPELRRCLMEDLPCDGSDGAVNIYKMCAAIGARHGVERGGARNYLVASRTPSGITGSESVSEPC